MEPDSDAGLASKNLVPQNDASLAIFLKYLS